MFLLDTNHCSYAILGNIQVLERLANLGDDRTYALTPHIVGAYSYTPLPTIT